MRCVNCGTELADDARFCYACGAEQPAEEQAVNIVADNVRICPFCGAQNDPDAKYCEECGKSQNNHHVQRCKVKSGKSLQKRFLKDVLESCHCILLFLLSTFVKLYMDSPVML